MTKKWRQFSPEFKFKVALEAAKGRKTISELASEIANTRDPILVFVLLLQKA
jgi:transposase-like protein